MLSRKAGRLELELTKYRSVPLQFVRQHGVIAFQKKGDAGHATRERGSTRRFRGFDCQNLNGRRRVEGWSRFEVSDNALERHYGVQTLFVESMIFFIGLQRFLRVFKNCLRFPRCFSDRVFFP